MYTHIHNLSEARSQPKSPRAHCGWGDSEKRYVTKKLACQIVSQDLKKHLICTLYISKCALFWKSFPQHFILGCRNSLPSLVRSNDFGTTWSELRFFGFHFNVKLDGVELFHLHQTRKNVFFMQKLWRFLHKGEFIFSNSALFTNVGLWMIILLFLFCITKTDLNRRGFNTLHQNCMHVKRVYKALKRIKLSPLRRTEALMLWISWFTVDNHDYNIIDWKYEAHEESDPGRHQATLRPKLHNILATK